MYVFEVVNSGTSTHALEVEGEGIIFVYEGNSKRNEIAGVDQIVFHFINGLWMNLPLDRAMSTFSWIGNLGVVAVALLGAMAAFGKKTGCRTALAGLAAFAIGFVCSELTKEMTMRRRPFAVLNQARLVSADVGLISLPEVYGGCYDH
jgi:small-conductance mechanosensitive channel